MPIYEYTCEACGEEFEKLVRRGADDIVCPACGASDVTKEFSAFACKSGARFTGSTRSSCSGCQPGPGGCAGCGH
jgi:putative FmdB family regulatory protein